MKKMMLLLAALVAFAAPVGVSAIDVEGAYIGGLGAASFLDSNRRHHDHFSSTSRRNRRHEYNVGYAAGGIIGYRMCEGFRGEFEATYRDNRPRRHRRGGDYRSWSFMFNGYYDFADWACMLWDVTPYVGAGVGYTTERVRFRNRRFDDELLVLRRRNRHHRKNGFAWQVMAGLSYPIMECAEIAIEYTFHKGRVRKFYHHDIGGELRYYF